MPLPRTIQGGRSEFRVRHEDCWAKTTESGRPGISVEQHCRTAGIVAGMLAAQYPNWLGETLGVRNGVVLAALHDIGKVSPGFQKKCPLWLKKFGLAAMDFMGMEEDHAKVSQKTIQDLLPDSMKFWAAIIGAHHGRLKGDYLPPLCDGGQIWESERRRLAEGLIGAFGPLPIQRVGYDDSKLWFNAGLIAVADWLASDDRAFPPSTILDAAAIQERTKSQFDRIGFRPVACLPGKIFSTLFTFPANALQKILAETVRQPGVYVVEAAMGCGKTEAALMASYNLLASGQATGIYFALPTQVTSNRIHQRVSAFIERISSGAGTRLIHGNSWLMEHDQSLKGAQNGGEAEGWRDGRDWFASSRRALLAPFGVGTVDQALLGVVAAKHFFVRQFGLAGKIVILDEVHSYDLYTGTLLDKLVKQLRELGATVIILSATLTASRRRKLLSCPESDTAECTVAYPLLSASMDGRIIEIPVEPDPPKSIRVNFMPESTLLGSVLARAERGECVLWIRNTVNEAQETYRKLCGLNRCAGPEIALLHSRFPQFRREELENDWLERLGIKEGKRPANGCVLVSTQVAEQSVDIDADLLVTDLAPTDMILQRIGRLWRHHRQRPAGCDAAEVWLATPALDNDQLRAADKVEVKQAFGKSAKVYAPYVLLRSFAVWHERKAITLPSDIRSLLESTYSAPAEEEPKAWGQLREELEVRKVMLEAKAITNSNPWQLALNDEEGVQTRWNNNPTAVVLLVRKVFAWDTIKGARLELLNGEGCDVKTDMFDYANARSIHCNLVKVPKWSVNKLINSTPRWLREYVRGEAVVCVESDGKLLSLPSRDETGLTYRSDLGVVIPQWQAPNNQPKRDQEEDDDESYD